jgi:uncharacterized membrane protein HdeD (DUF308 family)
VNDQPHPAVLAIIGIICFIVGICIIILNPEGKVEHFEKFPLIMGYVSLLVGVLHIGWALSGDEK